MSDRPSRETLFEEWLAAHRRILLKVSRSFARTGSEAADLEQEMMLQLWTSIPAYANQAKVSTYVYRVCLNTALMWRRGAGRREKWTDDHADIGRIVTEVATPADRAAQEDLLDKLYLAIRALPEFDRALVLLMLDGLAYRDIADITGLTENHVGVALTRARKRLIAQLKGVADELE